MNYDRRHIEALKKRHHVHHFPFLKLFILIAVLLFVLLALRV